MNIRTVSYSRLHSFGNYENETVCATAEVNPEETPDEALSHLREWVANQIAVRVEISAQHREVGEFTIRKIQLEREISELQERANKARKFLADHGLEVSEWELPF